MVPGKRARECGIGEQLPIPRLSRRAPHVQALGGPRSSRVLKIESSNSYRATAMPNPVLPQLHSDDPEIRVRGCEIEDVASMQYSMNEEARSQAQ